jgi:hypothetical protein
MENEAIGTPRIERIYNRLMDLDKLLGGSAEMYWQNVAMMIAFMADADAEWSPEEKQEMEEQLEELQHRLRRFLRMRGVEATNIAPGLQGADPGTHIDKQLEIIAGSQGMPKRILVGTERGELSSAQDENNWSSRIAERREQHAGPAIVEPFIQAGLRLGFLSGELENIEWPQGDTLGEEARASIANQKADALQKYLSAPGADLIIPPEDFRAWLGEEEELRIEPEDPLDDDEAVDQFRSMRSA